jgi:acyl carrier protein
MEDKIKSLMSEIFVLNMGEISDSTMRSDIEDWDSLQHLIFVSRLEQEFNVKFTPDEINQLEGFSGIKNILDSK